MLFDQNGDLRFGFVINHFSAGHASTLVVPFNPRYPRNWRARRARLEAK